jgi:high frequency lysogenization protein
MSQLNRDKTLALAAIFQAAGLANELARKGSTDSSVEAFLTQTVLVMDTDNISEIYPSIDGLKPGLRWLEGCLLEQGRGLQNAGEIIRIALGVIQVEGQFNEHEGVQNTLRTRLENINRQRVMNPDMSSTELNNLLGSAYVDSLGQLRFRVQIRGDAKQLQAPGMAERIRAILLAGVRAAWLWRRLGGRRWHLIFTRGQILREIREIAKSV